MKNPLLVPELREYLASNDTEGLREVLEDAHPGLVAEFLSALEPDEIWQAVQVVDPIQRADIFNNLDEDVQVEISAILPRVELARLISDLPPDDRVDLLKRFPEEKQEMILPAIAQAEREDIRRLSSYPEGSAGSVMTSDYAVLRPEWTTREAIERLRREAPNKETIYYTYVVDDTRKLLGFVSLKDLILASPDVRVDSIMHEDVIYAHVTEDQEEAARKIQKYDMLALPVINGDESLVGIITHDDALDIITQEQTEDIEKLMAITGQHEARSYLKTPASVHFKNRVGWIVCLAVVGLISGTIVHSFEDTLQALVILALYMPMLADTGGNTGSQSATVIVRALALRELLPKDYLRVIWKEFRVAVMLSMILGVLTWGRVMFLSGGTELPMGLSLERIGFAIALALSFQVISATLIGATLPMIAARLKLDPAVVASPALTTAVDITGLLLYFNTARYVLGI